MSLFLLNVWNNLKKCAVRKRAQARSVHARGTGGGPPSQIKQTDVEERILSLISSVAVDGHDGGQIPYDVSFLSFF